jgi:hypothetical protein
MASSARGAPVQPGDLEEKTRGEGFKRELGGREVFKLGSTCLYRVTPP